MNKLLFSKILSTVLVLLIFVLFVLRQKYGLPEPLASRLLLITALAAIASLTWLGIVGYKKTAAAAGQNGDNQ